VQNSFVAMNTRGDAQNVTSSSSLVGTTNPGLELDGGGRPLPKDNGGPFPYTGLPLTPATVLVTGAGGLSLTPTASCANNVNAGTATASYSYAGDANHDANSNSGDFTIGNESARGSSG
jgi:hypothetical protein